MKMLLIISADWCFQKIIGSGMAFRWSDTPKYINILSCFHTGSNLFIYQARESCLVPAGFLTAPFSAENGIYEAFVVIGDLRWSFSTMLLWRKEKVETSPSSIQSSLHIPFPPGTQQREAPPYFPHHNKGFINYVSCRNWGVRNPARLSSLVNKQVAQGAENLCCCPAWINPAPVDPITRGLSSPLMNHNGFCRSSPGFARIS